ncbi:hypothetical protein [Candidatus Poriferisodalis sp.]|uniref:hypothetical protein n=1 Tax=Candidatus Poriferisodalis sp. TaxID=3101277 RepID=UPI003B59E41C
MNQRPSDDALEIHFGEGPPPSTGSFAEGMVYISRQGTVCKLYEHSDGAWVPRASFACAD